MKKTAVLILTIVFILCASVFPASGDTATEFDTARESQMSESTVMAEGDSVEMQINITAPAVFAGIIPETGGEGRTLEISLYRWNTNLKKTLEGGKLLTSTVSGWEKGTAAGLSFDGLREGRLGAGEYVLRFTLVSGDAVEITRYLPPVRGVCCYDNGYRVFGSFEGKVVSAAPVEKIFDFASEEEDVEYHTAGPEPVPGPDSAIVSKNVDPTQWTAVDGLGRTLPGYGETGAKKDKKVGIFYWTWHLSFSHFKPHNVNNILTEYPDARNDYDHPVWAEHSAGSYFWNEPLYGYYTEADDYVLRNHAELLADAGVDFVLFDCTNGDYTWEPAYMNLLKVWSQAREEGVNTPKIAFMMQFGWSGNTLSSLTQIYEAIYRKGLYQDLWFYWEGKPLVMAHDDGLDLSVPYQAELANFFTFRAGDPDYFGSDNTDRYWGWLHKYPQALYKNEDGSVEMTTAGIAQNADYELQALSAMNGPHNMGRSYSGDPEYSYSYKYRGNTVTCRTGMENSKYYGINFQEQWDYAIAADPEIIFVTGWNEWIMGRNREWCGVANAFPDQCDDENSRDIEPSRGELKDYYYYQLVANVRRFKGTGAPVYHGTGKTIDVGGDISAWDDGCVAVYAHYDGGRIERDAEGWGGTRYVNGGVRNDITEARVTYDNDNIYFYVRTADRLSPPDGDNWMRLLIDAAPAAPGSPDWEEFEYVINRTAPESGGLVLERSTGGWNWEKVGNVDYDISDNILTLAVPRSFLGITGKRFSFGFKWCDANLRDGDIMTLYTDGDAAPGGRFCFCFATSGPDGSRTAVITAAVACCAVLAAGAAALTVFAVKRRRKR